MLEFLLLLAQTPDPISGGSGWIGAGLLGAVLSWLCMVHLPAKDKQLKELLLEKDQQMSDKDKLLKETIENKDKILQAALDHKWTVIDALGKKYTESLERVTLHCQQENELWRNEMGQLVRAIQDLSELVTRSKA